jgi:metal-sulfur cluster biosynthetic enzyme
MSAGWEIGGDGPADRREAAIAVLDAIIDPCSMTIGHPIGLAGMGMIERVDVTAGVVSILLLPTFPACIFRGFFEAEIEKRLRTLHWCESVSVAFCPAEQGWDESRMSPAAREALNRPSRQRRAALAAETRR